MKEKILDGMIGAIFFVVLIALSAYDPFFAAFL